jgi:hypothetical protein
MAVSDYCKNRIKVRKFSQEIVQRSQKRLLKQDPDSPDRAAVKNLN